MKRNNGISRLMYYILLGLLILMPILGDYPNLPPILQEIPVQYVHPGQPFTYWVDAYDPDGDQIEFSDNSPLFNITQQGKIAFTAPSSGIYWAAIIVTDPAGNYDYQLVKFVVSEQIRLNPLPPAIIFMMNIGFSETADILPHNATKSNTLNCTWRMTGDGSLKSNVTWYRNGVGYSTEKTISCLNNTLCFTHNLIPSTALTKYHVWNCTVLGYNGSQNQIKTAAINISNANPVLGAIPNAVIPEDSWYNYDVDASDPDGDTIQFSDNTNLFSIDPATGLIHWAPNNTQIGRHVVAIIAIDNDINHPGVDVKVVIYNVTAVNDAPYFSPTLTNQVINETQLFNWTIHAYDEEKNYPINFSDDSNLFDIANLSNTSARITFTPQFGDIGNHTVNITACDVLGACNTSTVVFTVRTINHNPVLIFIPNQTAKQGILFRLNLTAYDIDNDTMNFTANVTYLNITTTWNRSNATHNATGLISFVPQNNQVGNRSILIIVRDNSSGSDSQVVRFTINNTNDAPTITRPEGNLSTAVGVMFTYYILVNEPDIPYGDKATVHINASFINLSYSGANATHNMWRMRLLANRSLVGNHTLNISCIDRYNATDYKIINLEIRNNSIPYFDSKIGTLIANEDFLFNYQVQATDPDGDPINFTDNCTLFGINLTTGIIKFTPNNSQVGNYTVQVNVTDINGAVNSTTFLLVVNNTNDAPVLANITHLPKIVVSHQWTFYINASDDDILHNTNTSVVDNLTFADNSSFFNVTFYRYYKNPKQVWAVISFIPNESDIGNHTISINVTDMHSATDSQLVLFEILNISRPPVILNISPYGLPFANTTFGWYNASRYSNNVTYVNISENHTYIFNHTSISLDGLSLSYHWYNNGSIFGTNHTLQWNVSFFMQGRRNLTLVVEDERYATDYFTWMVNVSNANRPPVFSGPYPNVTMPEDGILSGALYKLPLYYSDPDNDVLHYNARQPEHVLIVVANDGTVTFTGQDNWYGITWTVFNATDGYVDVYSNNITINVTDVQDQNTGRTTGPSAGTGGGTITVTERVLEPIEVEVPKPVNMDLIVPRPIVMYENETILAPLVLRNRGNDTLKGITLYASTNATGVSLEFTKYYFNQLLPGQQVDTNLMVRAYKRLGTYEILVTAKVTDPVYNDTAIIFINSIEKNLENKSVTNTKIAFARDLLRENPICMELYELIVKADQALKDNNLARANLLVDSATEGCKYLIQNAAAEKQQPKSPFDGILNFILNNKLFRYVSLGLVAAIVIVSLIIYLQGRGGSSLRFREYKV